MVAGGKCCDMRGDTSRSNQEIKEEKARNKRNGGEVEAEEGGESPDMSDNGTSERQTRCGKEKQTRNERDLFCLYTTFIITT